MREDQADSGPAGHDGEPTQPVFDEDFVRAAPLREPAARDRASGGDWASAEPPAPTEAAPTEAAPTSPTHTSSTPTAADPGAPPAGADHLTGERLADKQAGPAQQADPRRLVAILVAVALVAGAVYFAAGRGPLSAHGAAGRHGASPSSEPTRAGSASVPFQGVPAAGYQDGPAGITLPAATATAGFSAAQVAAALRAAKGLLVATNLDPATLRGERPDAFLALLDPKDLMLRQIVRSALAHPTGADDITLFTTRFDPNEASPLPGQPVKAHGLMSYAPADDGLRIHCDYLFVYAVRATHPAPGAEPWTRVVVRRTLDIDLVDTSRFVATLGAIRLREHALDVSNATCGPYNGFIHPYFGATRGGDPTPSGSPVDPYDLGAQPTGAAQDSCGMVSRV